MGRDAAGNYTLPVGNPVTTGTVISASWANDTLDDIALAITESLDRQGRGGMLAPFENANGFEATPGITWANEPSSGFWLAGLGDMRVSIQGQDLFRWHDSKAFVWDTVDTAWDEVLTSGGAADNRVVPPGTAASQTLRWDLGDDAWEVTDLLLVGDTYVRVTHDNLPTFSIDGTTASRLDLLVNGADGGRLVAGATGVTLRSMLTHLDVVADNGNIRFKTLETEERLTIMEDGDVGLGTNNPSARLHIIGDEGFSPLRVDNSNTVNDSVHASLVLTAGNLNGAAMLGHIRGAASTYGGLAFFYSDNSSLLEAMRIADNGNISIGTTTTDCTLRVENSLTDTEYALRITTGAAGSYQFGVRNDGELVATSIGSQANTPNLSINAQGFIRESTTVVATDADLVALEARVAALEAFHP